MKFRRRLKIEKGHLDLTPLVNVFFLLLVFFIFTSSFMFQPGIKVGLPRAVTGDMLQQEAAVLIVSKDDLMYLDDREISMQELASKLAMLAKDGSSLLIKADSRSSHGKMVQIWDMCRARGISRVSFATER